MEIRLVFTILFSLTDDTGLLRYSGVRHELASNCVVADKSLCLCKMCCLVRLIAGKPQRIHSANK